VAAGEGLGVLVVRADALLVAHEEPLSEAVVVAQVEEEPLKDCASVIVATPEDDAQWEGLWDGEVQPEGLPLGELLPVGEPASLGEGDSETRDGVACPLFVPLKEPQKLVVLCAD
jgi:hypothetical protein